MPKRKQGKRDSEKSGEGKASKNNEEGWSKSKKRHMRKIQRRANDGGSTDQTSTTRQHGKSERSPSEQNPPHETVLADTSAIKAASTKLDLGTSNIRPKSQLQQAFLSRLAGSRFRELNEDLYTSNSSSAFERFQNNPELFDQYHEGFRTQVKAWPVNPVDVVHRWILSVHKRRSKDGKAKKKLKIADFGCGDAMLAQKLLQIKEEGSGQTKKERKQNSQSACPFHVNSFDLVANGNPHITPCDMANVPLESGSADIAVFVLALMGTNIADFMREAHRVLTADGKLKIAEVRSRFESAFADDQENGSFSGKKGKGKQNFKYSKKKADDSLLNEFIEVMQELGFKCNQNDRSNKMFFLLEFEKTGKRPSKEATFTAKPCIYKRR
jgi:ribosomal RNA-processing protein 8